MSRPRKGKGLRAKSPWTKEDPTACMGCGDDHYLKNCNVMGECHPRPGGRRAFTDQEVLSCARETHHLWLYDIARSTTGYTDKRN